MKKLSFLQITQNLSKEELKQIKGGSTGTGCWQCGISWGCISGCAREVCECPDGRICQEHGFPVSGYCFEPFV